VPSRCDSPNDGELGDAIGNRTAGRSSDACRARAAVREQQLVDSGNIDHGKPENAFGEVSLLILHAHSRQCGSTRDSGTQQPTGRMSNEQRKVMMRRTKMIAG